MAVDLGANDVVLVTIEGKLDGQQTISTFYYKTRGVTAATPMFTALTDFITKLRGAGKLMEQYLVCVSEQMVDIQMYAQVVYPIRYRYTDGGFPLVTGQYETLSLPANVQASITRAAERAGRKYVGHLSLPGIPIEAVENSEITADYLLKMDTLAEKVLQTIVLADGTEMVPCLFNKVNDPVWVPITFAFPQTTSRVIRRRTVGLGS